MNTQPNRAEQAYPGSGRWAGNAEGGREGGEKVEKKEKERENERVRRRSMEMGGNSDNLVAMNGGRCWRWVVEGSRSSPPPFSPSAVRC